MLLLRTTSIAGLVATLAGMNSSINANNSALSVINNPDETVAGSLAKTLKDGKDYADSVFAGIDLSQVTTNKDAIALLNNADNTVAGSIAKTALDTTTAANNYSDAKKTEVVAQITPLSDAITIINGADTVDGSINKAIKDLIGGAPAEFDTLKEIADKLTTDETAMGALTTTVSDNKAAAEQALADHISTYNTEKDAIYDRIATERTQTNNDIAAAVSNYNTTAEGKFLQIANNLSEISGDLAAQAAARTNLGCVSNADVVAFGEANKDLFKQETITVNSGIVPLDSGVTIAHIEHVRINYPGNEFDTPVFEDGANAGEFKVYDASEGDLDGVDVEVKYVQQQL